MLNGIEQAKSENRCGRDDDFFVRYYRFPMSTGSTADIPYQSELTARVKSAARASGFDLVGVADVGPATHPDFFREWLAAGKHRPMSHIFENGLPARLDPRTRHPWACSVISLGVRYGAAGCAEPDVDAKAELSQLTIRPHLPHKPECDNLDPDGWRNRHPGECSRSAEIIGRSPALGVWPWIARYERDANYHRINDGNIERFARRLSDAVGRPVRMQEVVDHGAFFERDLAYQAGLGWVGKNNMIIHPQLGSFFVLTSVFVDVELMPDALVPDHCGSCVRCLEACPTGALDGPRNITIDRCLTARSVDIGGTVPEEYAPHLAGHLSGCDICQDACPYNADVAASPRTVGPAPERWRAITLIDIMSCDETERRIFVSGSLLARISPETLKRNAILAGARILKVAVRKRFDDDLDRIASQVHSEDLPALVQAVTKHVDSPDDGIRAAASYALSF